MEQQTSNERRNSEEVDLMQFFRWIGDGFRSAGNAIIRGMAGLRNIFFNNRLFFIGVIVIGLILGALYSVLLKKEYYKSTMVLSCDYLNNQIVENAINKLNLVAGQPGSDGLEGLLNIDSATAVKIQSFEFKPFVSADDIVETEVLREQLSSLAPSRKDMVEKVVKKLAITNKTAYEISVFVFDPTIVKRLETALVAYFRNNNYIKGRIEVNKKNLLVKREKLVAESKKLDSLKGVIFSNLKAASEKSGKGSNNVILGDETPINPIDVFREDIQVNDFILDIDRRLSLGTDFEVIDGFSTHKHSESASLRKIFILSFFISWLMGYLIIGVWRFDKMLASYNAKTVKH